MPLFGLRYPVTRTAGGTDRDGGDVGTPCWAAKARMITTSTLPGAERVARRTSLRKDVATARRSSEPTGTAGLRHGLW